MEGENVTGNRIYISNIYGPFSVKTRPNDIT